MKNVFKTVLVAIVLCIMGTSCTKSSLSEEDNLYENATEGNTGDPKEEKEDPNQ